jgi:aspartyl aminopeptidase
MTRLTEAAPDITDEADGLCTFVDASPSPFHACQEAAAALGEHGFARLAEADPWPAAAGRYVVVRGGSLIAWSTERSAGPTTGFRVVGAHTDSPNLRIKPQPDLCRAGWQLLGVEVYGAPMLNSWLDRGLGLSGRLAVRTPGGVEERLLRVDEPLLRVLQLAIHLDRELTDRGLQLNRQQHLAPVWGVGSSPGDFRGYLAGRAGVDAEDLLGFDLMTHDLALSPGRSSPQVTWHMPPIPTISTGTSPSTRSPSTRDR